MLVARPPTKNSRSVTSNRLRESSGAAGAAGVWARAAGAHTRPKVHVNRASRNSFICFSLSTHEELARWVVRAVNVRVAVHARSAEHPVALVGRNLVLVVQRGRMFAGDVT